jgi:hypothetical protein
MELLELKDIRAGGLIYLNDIRADGLIEFNDIRAGMRLLLLSNTKYIRQLTQKILKTCGI